MPGRILIVEDAAVLRKSLARLLTREGYEVTTAGNVAEAFRQLQGMRFGALLLDISLPDGDGLELLAALGKWQRPAQTVVMTAFSSPENELRARGLEVQHVLRKPLDLAQILAIISAAGDRREPIE